MKGTAIVRVWGGLGNQLFIYSFARLLSLKFNLNVLLENRTGFTHDGYSRQYRLNNFKINISGVTYFQSLFFFVRRNCSFLEYFLFSNSDIYLENEVEHKNLDGVILPINDKIIYYQGYWQWIDFSSIRDILLKEFVFQLPTNARYDEIANRISKTNSVAVHLRRIQYDSLLSLDYYNEGVKFMKNEIDSPLFYVFSDDIEWCKKNIPKVLNVVFVDNFDHELYELKLMSLCNHFIIANSTFSWWGAWLSQNENKIVIMPQSYTDVSMNGHVIHL